MNRHEDELEKEIADKYIENMDAPDLWGKIEAGLDAVDAQRVQDKKSGDKKLILLSKIFGDGEVAWDYSKRKS